MKNDNVKISKSEYLRLKKIANEVDQVNDDLSEVILAYEATLTENLFYFFDVELADIFSGCNKIKNLNIRDFFTIGEFRTAIKNFEKTYKPDFKSGTKMLGFVEVDSNGKIDKSSIQWYSSKDVDLECPLIDKVVRPYLTDIKKY